MKSLRNNLSGNECNERHKKQKRSSQVPPIESHGHGITASLAQRGCGNFYDPENERNLGDFAQGIFGGLIHAQGHSNQKRDLFERYSGRATCRRASASASVNRTRISFLAASKPRDAVVWARRLVSRGRAPRRVTFCPMV